MNFLRHLTISLALAIASSAAAEPQSGEAIYRSHCAACHEAGERAPRPEALKQFSPERVVTALIDGPMSQQGRSLNAAEIHDVAAFVTGKPFGAGAMPKTAYCADTKVSFDRPFAKPFWNGWGAGETNERSQSAAMAGLHADDVPRLKLKWAFAIPGVIRAYGQPTIVGGTIFIGTAADKVYALDAKTGCIRWAFDADAGVRTAISIGAVGSRWMAYFGDLRGQAYAVDAATGTLVWKVRLDDNPLVYITGAPTLDDGRLYIGVASREETSIGPGDICCKFRGSVSALDAATGRRIWKSYTIPDAPHATGKDPTGREIWGPAGGGVWSAPTVDRKRRALYIGTGNSYSSPQAPTTDALMALDMESGKMLWVRQMTPLDLQYQTCAPAKPCTRGPDYDFGSSPVLVDLPGGGRALVAGQKSGIVHAVDPDHDGKILWQTRIGRGGYEGGIEFGIAADGRNAYAALSDFRLQPAKPGEPGAHPTILGFTVRPDSKSGGGLFALDLATGKQVWTTPPPGCGDRVDCSAAQSAAVTTIPGVVFSGSLDGHLRAYATGDGRILWDVDTAHDYQAVDLVPAKGGSIDGPGPVVVDGVVYTNSGYGYVGGMTGNVLLAFSVDGR